MKNANISLHYGKKKILLLMILTSLLLIAVILFTLLPASDNFVQLDSLLHSKYRYSALLQQSTQNDDYFIFYAGIEFSASYDSPTSINADIVMQTAESEYTDSVCWNAKKLSPFEVAISDNLASRYHLNTGSILYSRSVIDGKIYEYTITQIVPGTTNIRTSQSASINSGIIIMGYQSQYEESVSHDCVFFTNELVDDIAHKYVEMPRNTIYRDDEISTVIRRLIPYCILVVLMYSMLILIQAVFLKREISHNFKRLLTLGADASRLNKSYTKYAFCASLGSGLIALIVSVCFAFSFGIVRMSAFILLALLLVHIIILLAFISFSKKQMWRN